jgi:hypothetical protein
MNLSIDSSLFQYTEISSKGKPKSRRNEKFRRTGTENLRAFSENSTRDNKKSRRNEAGNSCSRFKPGTRTWICEAHSPEIPGSISNCNLQKPRKVSKVSTIILMSDRATELQQVASRYENLKIFPLDVTKEDTIKVFLISISNNRNN